MPIHAENLGPGTLTLGTGPLAVELQLTACKLVPAENVTTDDAVKVLSGDVLPESTTETYSWTLQGTYLQDLRAAGVNAWSWVNKGTEQDFTFEPNSSAASFEGVLKPVPLQVGGDEVGRRMTADFTWRCVGDPVPSWTP